MDSLKLPDPAAFRCQDAEWGQGFSKVSAMTVLDGCHAVASELA
jgi:hypothetical protein